MNIAINNELVTLKMNISLLYEISDKNDEELQNIFGAIFSSISYIEDVNLKDNEVSQ